MPRTKEVFESMRETTRLKIEAAALSLFARKGLSVTMDDIAKEAEISKGLIYNHYISKEALITELVRQAVNKSAQAITMTAQTQTDARDTIKMISRIMCEMFSSHEYMGVEYFMFMLQVGMSGFEIPAEAYYSKDAPAPAETLAKIIAQGQAEGTVAEGDAFQLSLIYWAVVQGLCCHAIVGMPVAPLPDMLNRLLLTN